MDLQVSKSTIFWRKSSMKRHKSHFILTVKSLWCLCQKVVRTFNFKVFITLLLIALFFKSLKQYIQNTTWNDIWHLNSSKKPNHDLSQIETFSSCWQRSVSKGWKGASMWLGRFVILSTKSQSITEQLADLYSLRINEVSKMIHLQFGMSIYFMELKQPRFMKIRKRLFANSI